MLGKIRALVARSVIAASWAAEYQAQMRLINLDWGDPDTLAMMLFFFGLLALIIGLEYASPKKKKNRGSKRNFTERRGDIID
ncbi:hypothetical protein [Sphingomonas faeni]|uniref:hypothetical protein n=1 Tax=Sphingomonas faeni TaxID=185950 RepID=UPI00334882CF